MGKSPISTALRVAIAAGVAVRHVEANPHAYETDARDPALEREVLTIRSNVTNTAAFLPMRQQQWFYANDDWVPYMIAGQVHDRTRRMAPLLGG